jgi:hypothetical protein
MDAIPGGARGRSEPGIRSVRSRPHLATRAWSFEAAFRTPLRQQLRRGWFSVRVPLAPTSRRWEGGGRGRETAESAHTGAVGLVGRGTIQVPDMAGISMSLRSVAVTSAALVKLGDGHRRAVRRGV